MGFVAAPNLPLGKSLHSMRRRFVSLVESLRSICPVLYEIHISIYIYIFFFYDKSRIWQCLFCFWFKTFPHHQSFARTTFGKLSQRPIELEEFSEKGRSLDFGDTPLCWLSRDVLQSYREEVREKLKCVAEPYKNEGCERSRSRSMLPGRRIFNFP